MKNTYLIGYFPLISIILFSLSFAMYGQTQAVRLLKQVGIYQGMLEFFSETGIALSLLIVLMLFFFMFFAALKLISDTVVELSLLFFSKESEGTGLKAVRFGGVIYMIGSVISLLTIPHIVGLGAVFLGTTLIAFLNFVYKVSSSLDFIGLVGLMFFHIFVWTVLVSIIVYSVLKLYNSVMASLPI